MDEGDFQNEVAQRSSEVNMLLNKKDKVGALKKALENPPVLAKSVSVKVENAEIVDKVLGQIPDSEMAAAINALDQEACDVFMKYAYLAMSKPGNYGPILKAHAVLVDKGGMGCIIRALTDRKTVS